MTATINNNEYSFVNESWGTRRSWGHKSYLYKNGQLISEAKATYINRTWEAYQYQSCMRSAVCKLLYKQINEMIEQMKAVSGIKRLNKDLREQWTSEFKNESDLVKLLNKL